MSQLRELATVFLKLGATAFGGPAAHVAAIQNEVVDRKQWISRERLLELFATTNLIPGPNSTELVMQIGYERAGWPGLVIAGSSFILPAILIVWGLAWGYQQFQFLPQVKYIFAGLQPVVAGLVAQALWKLSKSALKISPTWTIASVAPTLIGLMTIGACLLKVDEVLWLILMGVGMMLWQNWRSGNISGKGGSGQNLSVALLAGLPTAGKAVSAGSVFGIFFKIGLVMYGGGYVLIAFLQQELVDRQHLLTSQQLLDAVSIGQITPGPLFTTATFIGYLLAGHGGAIAGTVGIFLPGFLLVALLRPWLDKVQDSPWIKGFLAGINPAAWGLMAFVVGQLGLGLTSWPVRLMAIGSLLLLLKWPNISLWLMLGGAIVGWIFKL
jgi:chromate transporter